MGGGFGMARRGGTRPECTTLAGGGIWLPRWEGDKLARQRFSARKDVPEQEVGPFPELPVGQMWVRCLETPSVSDFQLAVDFYTAPSGRNQRLRNCGLV